MDRFGRRGLFDARCTVLNRFVDPVSRMECWQPCALRGVSWQGGGAVTDSRLPHAGNVMVYIPAAVEAAGVYAAPRGFLRAPRGRWTLREGDLLVPGVFQAEADPEGGADVQALLEGEDGAVTIVSVGESRFGRDRMHHWEVCAR